MITYKKCLLVELEFPSICIFVFHICMFVSAYVCMHVYSFCLSGIGSRGE